MIIVLVCLRLSQQDEMERFYTSIRFTATSTTAGGTISQVRRTMPNAHVVDLEISYPYIEEAAKIVTDAPSVIELGELPSKYPLGEASALS